MILLFIRTFHLQFHRVVSDDFVYFISTFFGPWQAIGTITSDKDNTRNVNCNYSEIVIIFMDGRLL